MAPECSAIAVAPSRARDGRLLTAQNWDWLVDAAETLVLLEVSQGVSPQVELRGHRLNILDKHFQTGGLFGLLLWCARNSTIRTGHTRSASTSAALGDPDLPGPRSFQVRFRPRATREDPP